jgi:flagellar biosynthesis protein FlhF
MQVKRFVAENMRLALNMVREEMGDDAVILSNKRVEGGVEILTALDPDGHLTSGKTTERAKPVAAPMGSSDNPFQQEGLLPVGSSDDVQPSRLERELDRMQRGSKQRAKNLVAMLNDKKSSQSASERESGEAKQSSRALESNEVDFSKILAASVDSSESASVDIRHHRADGIRDDNPAISASQSYAETMSLNSSYEAPSKSGPLDESVADGEFSHMRSEIQSMRDMMEGQLSSMAWGQFSTKNPQKACLWRRLKRMGLDAEISNHILAETDSSDNKKSVWQAMMADLSHKLPVAEKDLVASGGVYAFVGPTGAGKTTTIGKLAARYVLKNGSSDIALISTDTARIGAYEQLRTFGRILNVPVKIVDDKNTLDKVLYSVRDKSLVLIDTGGLNRLDPRLQHQFDSINRLNARVKTVMVLPATSQAAVLKAAYKTYKTNSLMNCVITKLDEAMSLGEVISLAITKNMCIAYSTDGQAVPADIAVANGKLLVSTAIKMAQEIEVDSESMMDELASVSKSG